MQIARQNNRIGAKMDYSWRWWLASIAANLHGWIMLAGIGSASRYTATSFWELTVISDLNKWAIIFYWLVTESANREMSRSQAHDTKRVF